jgi:hypothetical protein
LLKSKIRVADLKLNCSETLPKVPRLLPYTFRLVCRLVLIFPCFARPPKSFRLLPIWQDSIGLRFLIWEQLNFRLVEQLPFKGIDVFLFNKCNLHPQKYSFPGKSFKAFATASSPVEL